MPACTKARERTTAHQSKARRIYARRTIDELIQTTTQSINGNSARRDAFMHLVRTTRSRTSLLSPIQPNRYGPHAVCEMTLQGLANVSSYRKAWQRDLESWEPPDGSRRRVFASLLRHLFFGHKAPDAFVASWLQAPSRESSQHQRWFLHICATGTIRGTDTPFTFTRLAAKRLFDAPHHLSVLDAMRWAVSEKPYPHVVKPDGINRRKWKAIQAATQQWQKSDWKRMPKVTEFLWTENQSSPYEPTTWSIHEITRRAELIREGDELNHCVGSYAEKCLSGYCAIFSLKRHVNGVAKRMLTIEVRPHTRRIVMALGVNNSRPAPQARQLMNRWAKSNNLCVPHWV